MRAVVQRVARARVTVGDEEVLRMGEGLLALVGVGRSDTAAAAGELARRIVHLRIFEDAEQRMNRSLLETGGTLGDGVPVHTLRRRPPGPAALSSATRCRPSRRPR